MKQVAVFTDLDGTFLDHHTYEYDRALPAVHWLKSKGVPLFSISSKTLAEQLDLFEEEGIFDGYVAENGGVVHYRGQTQVLGPARDQIDLAVRAMEERLGRSLAGFKPENLDGVIKATGLNQRQALLACDRLCSEPLICDVDDSVVPELDELASTFGTVLVHGGRFLTVCGKTDKGSAMKLLAKLHFGATEEVHLIALGDSANDLSMLHAADEGILMPNPSGKGVSSILTKGLTCPHVGGPDAWAEAVTRAVEGCLKED